MSAARAALQVAAEQAVAGMRPDLRHEFLTRRGMAERVVNRVAPLDPRVESDRVIAAMRRVRDIS